MTIFAGGTEYRYCTDGGAIGLEDTSEIVIWFIGVCQMTRPISQECHDSLKLAVAAIWFDDDQCPSEREMIVDVGKCLAMKNDLVDFDWTIDRLDERARDAIIDSGYFYVCQGRYKMFLSCKWCCNNHTEVNVYLRICKGDGDLQWPFDRFVTMSLCNKGTPQVSRTITDRCKIARPYSSSQSSLAFTFRYTGLSNAGLLKDSCVTVQCIIHDE